MEAIESGASEVLEELSLIQYCSLFPTMPRHNYWKAAPLVKALCDKHGIEYKSKTLLTAFVDILQ